LNVTYHNYFQFFKKKNDFELKSELCGLAIFLALKTTSEYVHLSGKVPHIPTI
jgi:hypothetical protein